MRTICIAWQGHRKAAPGNLLKLMNFPSWLVAVNWSDVGRGCHERLLPWTSLPSQDEWSWKSSCAIFNVVPAQNPANKVKDVLMYGKKHSPPQWVSSLPVHRALDLSNPDCTRSHCKRSWGTPSNLGDLYGHTGLCLHHDLWSICSNNGGVEGMLLRGAVMWSAD